MITLPAWIIIILAVCVVGILMDNFRKYQQVTELRHVLKGEKLHREEVVFRLSQARDIAQRSFEDMYSNGHGVETLKRVIINLHRIKNF